MERAGHHLEELHDKELTEEEKEILAESNPDLAAAAEKAAAEAPAPETDGGKTLVEEDGDYEEAYADEEE